MSDDTLIARAPNISELLSDALSQIRKISGSL
jgi:hypothetical protein